MSIIATAVKHLIAAGVSGDDLVRAIADMEANQAQILNEPVLSKRQLRNKRHYERLKTSEKRLNSDDQDVSDGCSDLLSPEGSSPTPPSPKPQSSIPPSPPLGGSSPTDRAIEIFSEHASKAGIAVPRKVTVDRRRKIEARLREHGEDTWQEACRRMAASSFCRGENDRGWRADLDFLCQPKSFNGLIEGKYDDRPHQSRAPPGRERTIFDAIDDFTGRNTNELSAGTTIDLDGGDYSPNVHLLASPARR
ncbi:DNA replication protein [Rhizobium sp. CNPSo 4062]|uniref:DNA replication protein n=1 Tax=Rhizobium sp. CNPSo 4062 TaxID=3021410 RepID=UPI00254CECE4|nr:DNA replication protein [Rhizobium sp. CNPSo 4062]MDK4703884.1 DNA replication protein [Rhizobium sp. CNPSo 4062]